MKGSLLLRKRRGCCSLLLGINQMDEDLIFFESELTYDIL